MKKLFTLLFLAVFACSANAQFGLTQLGHLSYDSIHGSGINDIWGYVDELGNEYALIGVDVGGASVVDLSDPADPTEVFFSPGPPSTWRDLKVWNDFAYVTTEAGGGLTIIDLSPLPQNTNLQDSTIMLWPIGAAHNIQIDENGICHIQGPNNGSTLIYDLNPDPWSPVYLGTIQNGYSHDAYIRGDTAYQAQIYLGMFTVWDVSDPANAVLLGSQQTPADFCHNIWVSDDGNYAFTTDEVDGSVIVSWDISDLTDINEVDRFQSFDGSEAAPHNTFYKDGYLFTSYYRDGLQVHDATHPDNIVKVGEFDSSPLAGGGFDGAWGVYPFFPSGNMIVSDREEGLFVLATDPMHACFVHGTVTDDDTNLPISNVEVKIIGTSELDMTNIGGDYATGTAVAGTYDIAFFRPDYEPDTAYGVQLLNGVDLALDWELTHKTTFNLYGQVLETGTGNVIPNAQIRFEGPAWTYEDDADSLGNFSIQDFIVGDYEVFGGSWGHTTTCYHQINFDGTDSTFNIHMQPGYYDDFSFDLGWSISGSVDSGEWVLTEPIGLNFGPSIWSPYGDEVYDCGEGAYMTAESPIEFVQGATVLVSPEADVSTMTDPWVNMHIFYYYNNEDTVAPDPNYRIRIRDDQFNSAVVADEDMTGPWLAANGWDFVTFRLNDFMTGSNEITTDFRVTNSSASGNYDYFKFGVDKYWISEGPVSTEELSAMVEEAEPQILAYPNPFNLAVNLQISPRLEENAQVVVLDLQGRVVQRLNISPDQTNIQLSGNLTAGMYLVRIEGADRTYPTVRLIKE